MPRTIYQDMLYLVPLKKKKKLSKCERTEITQIKFSDHTGIKLEISNRNTTGKSQILRN
jgi:hypothetical protein